MNYSKIQKIISFIVLFSFFFTSIFSFPNIRLYDKASASSSDFYDLVSVLVNQKIYNVLKSDVQRYAEDIQNNLENTKVVILPIPNNATAFDIASLNEWLYFNGYKSLNSSVNFNSKLIWTVLIWKIPLPVINKSNKSTISIAPYVDFEDKTFVYDHKTKRYIFNQNAVNKFKPEIWHWVISPNTWSQIENIKDIKSFLDKDHNFYIWKWQFKQSVTVTNWNKDEKIEDKYKPYVFYYDQFREQKSIKYSEYKWYEAYLENIEDLNYHRYSKVLAKKIQDKVLWAQNEEFDEVLSKIKNDKIKDLFKKWNWPDTSNAPWISTRYIINKAIKRFIEIFNKGTISDFRTNVHNAWRYNEKWDQVNVDMIPYFISILDDVSAKVILDVDKKLTDKIDDLVINWLSRNIAIPVKIERSVIKTHFWTWYNYSWDCFNVDKNYLNWVYAENIKTAKDCSIYRWSNFDSWNLVVASRWLDLKLVKSDITRLTWKTLWNLWNKSYACLSTISDWKWWKILDPANFKWYWGWFSPLNINQNTSKDWILKLSYSFVKKSITPLFDVKWAKKVTNWKSPSVLDCFDNNLLSYERRSWNLDNYYFWWTYDYNCKLNFRLWDLNNGWSCKYDNEKYKNNFSSRFENYFKQNNNIKIDDIKKCWTDYFDVHKKVWNHYIISRYYTIYNNLLGVNNKSCKQWNLIDKTTFKIIPSYVIHKSPTSSELFSEIKTISTPNLPIDKIRYIDFIWAKWDHEKIVYPEFFKLKQENKKKLTIKSISEQVDKILDEKSKEINNIIKLEDPSKLIWVDKEIYNILSTNHSEVYSKNIDLKKYLKSLPSKTIKIAWENKTMNYYDFIVFSIYWNNLKSISAKYKFIIENYLSDQSWWNNYNFILPKNKAEYEINYIWAPWDAKNMYIKMDPEEKNLKNNYSNLIKLNTLLDSNIFGLKLLPDSNKINTNQWNNSSWVFKCAPPDWVVLWKWIPAVMCRLKNMLPPKIGISDGDCWVGLLWDSWTKNPFSDEKWMSDEAKADIKHTKTLACYWDLNKNWINDCLEKKLAWSSLDFKSDASRYYYWKNWILSVIVKDKNNRRVYIDNNTTVYFHIEKIVDKDKNKIIFDSKKEEYNSEKYKDYINFWNFWVQTRAWKAIYNFSTGNKDVDVYFKTYLKLKDKKTWKDNLLMISKPLKIEVRWDRLFLTSANKLDNSINLGWSYAIADDKINLFIFNKKISNFDKLTNWLKQWDLVFALSNLNKNWDYIDFEYPLNILIQDKNKNPIFEENINSLSNLKWLIALKKSWLYNLIITDSKWFKVKKEFEIKASIPSKVDLKLWTNILSSSWAISTNYVVIYDRFWNPTVWDYYDIDLSIDGNSAIFNINKKNKISYTTIEWFRAFRIKSTNNIWNVTIKAKVSEDWKEILSTSKQLKVIDNISLKVVPDKILKVWNKDIHFKINILDENWKLLSNLQSRIYLQINKIYWKTIKPYFDIKNWQADIEFITSKLAGQNIPFKFQIEWFNKIYTKNFNILPLKPLKVQIIPSKIKFEASRKSYTKLNIELKDVYWNTIFNDNSTKLNLEILDKYRDIINSNIDSKIVKNGKSFFIVNATDIPWEAYVKISTSPSLSNNYFEIKWQAPFLKGELDKTIFVSNWKLTDIWKKIFYEVDDSHYRFLFNSKNNLLNSKVYNNLEAIDKRKLLNLFNKNNIYRINWVWANVVKLKTYFFWKASDIIGKKYNALYSVLLWADYWNITKKDYLASWILFDKNNRWLAVTSLLSSPYKYNDILSLTSLWRIDSITNNSDLSQNINFNLSIWKNKPFINLYNKNLSTEIWKIFFNFGNDNNLQICNNIINCKLSKNKTSIIWVNTSSNFEYSISNHNLVLNDIYGKKIFSISNKWKIILNDNILFTLSSQQSNKLIFNVLLNWNIIWKLAFDFINWDIKATRDKLVLNWLLKSTNNNIIVYLATDRYWIRNIYWVNNFEKVAIYYNDPFEKKNSLNIFASWKFTNFDNFVNKWWIGWKDENLAMLSFAAWNSVWKSVENYQSLLLVNLWDPVVSLKKRHRKKPKVDWYKKFNRTIWRRINKKDIDWYRVFDYNDDKKPDILLLNSDKYLSLYENQDVNGNFIDLKNLARVADLWDIKNVQTWDFTGDWYDDIFFVNNKWNPYILNNHLKKFTRFDLTKQFNLNAKITIAKAFDMDHDWVTDIVTLDDDWNINIFYGTKNSKEPRFTKKLIYSWYWVKLSKKPRDDYWLVYFKWVPQLNPAKDNQELIKQDQKLSQEIQNSIKNNSNNTQSILGKYNKNNSWINKHLLNSLIYVNVPYWNNPKVSKSEQLISAISWVSDSSEMSWSIQDTKNSIKDFVNNNSSSIWDISTNATKQTTFIRSQYSEPLWIKVNKIFIDRNWWNLKSWDIVNVTTTLKNITSHNIENIVYIEDFPKVFNLVDNSIKNSQNLKTSIPQDFWKILIKWINLKPWQSFSLTYNLKTRRFSFGYIKVWLFEKWEVWDDLYWDIIVKKNQSNCSQNVSIFRSIWKRSYQKWIKQPSCNSNKLKLPKQLDNPDKNHNWIPDYLDTIINDAQNWKTDKLQDYAKNKLDNLYLDSDNDWLPDSEDLSPAYWNSEDLSDNLNKINQKVDEISAWIDKIMDWLSCWFWGWSCLALPMNWAPLAPWSDPTLFWMPVWDWLKVWEWLPIFSMLTWISWPFCAPITTVWPPSPFAYPTWTCWWLLSAWGRLWTWSPTNMLRIFYTPTLTWWQWLAVCFWWPAMVAWYGILPWISPIVPGWNCIVAAAPLWACNKDDEDLGDPTSMWTVTYFWWGNISWWNNNSWFWIINWNCKAWSSSKNKLLPDTNKINLPLVNEYINYQKTWITSKNLISSFKKAFSNPNNWQWSSYSWLPSWLNWDPLISINWGNWDTASMDMSLDLKSLVNWNFQDVIKIKNTRIAAFPGFLMDWVTRQVEEIVTKLTDFPTLYIILPDFSSILDTNWVNYISNGVKKSYEQWKEKQEKKDNSINSKIQSLESRKSWLNCNWNDKAYCDSIDNQIENLNLKKWVPWAKQYSWISQAYEFLSSVPIVSINPEEVDVNIPWIDKYTLTKTINDWKNTLAQWKHEVKRFEDDVSFGWTCSWTAKEIKQCKNEKSIKQKVSLDTSRLIWSLEQNISILENWEKMPEKLSTLINKKQDRLNQILCNINTISTLIGWWIWKNWIRFKAWVQTYILVKAILKSWQLLADLFINFDAECHQCKNERNDLMYYILKLISFIIPKIPVIQFPKWPDIILDLHNIRLSIKISVPDFRLNKRPIVLPTLPELKLPTVPNVNITLPSLPLLPNFEIPELPDLPTLPTITLPDLPPPPKLPKLFASIEWVINILKLVAKALCILKSSPFVPEWRAGDQIAFLTERTGYLPTDFLDFNLPQFSYPFVDAIKVTTWVNFEQDTEFLTEMARNIVKPINSFTNNIVNVFNINPDAFDFSELTPSDINIWKDKIWFNKNSQDNKLISLAYFISVWLARFIHTLDIHKNETISNNDFIYKVNRDLAKNKYISDSRYDNLRNTWSNISKIKLTKQDEIISKALKNNLDKFETVKSIIENEKTKDKSLLKEIKSIWIKKYENVAKKVNSDFVVYNKALSKYNDIFKQNAEKLILWWNKKNNELKSMWNSLLTRVKNWISNYSKQILKTSKNYKNNLLASNTLKISSSSTKSTLNSCQLANSKAIKYKYDWIYVVENWWSYKLFDYTDKLTWKEEPKAIDFDNDWDDDLLYMMDNNLYLKQNLSKKDVKHYVDTPPLEVDSNDNKFLNWKYFIEAVNNFRESAISNQNINVNFSASTDSNINNYRLSFYDRIDKNLKEGDSNYIPKNLRQTIIDLISDKNNLWIIKESTGYTISNNIAYFKYIWTVPWVNLITDKLDIINNSLYDWKLASITANKRLYSWWNWLKIYYINADDKKESIYLDKHSNISFKNSVKIYKIIWWKLYVNSWIKEVLKGQDIMKYLDKPILFDTEIRVENYSWLTEASHIDIWYYDWWSLGLDLRKINFYRLYDLWFKSDAYLLNLSIANDYYYSIINAFSGKTIWTRSKQVLLSPQLAADTTAPEFSFDWTIKIPVYQAKVIDFTDYLFDNSWIDNIAKIEINRLNPPKYKVFRSPWKIKIEFWKFDNIFKTKISIKVIDKNWNETHKDVKFEVYSPVPQINDYKNKNINWIINEKLTNEPINIYRVRWWIITRLETTENKTRVHTLKWIYNFTPKWVTSLSSETLVLKDDISKILDVSWNTWLLKLKRLWYNISIRVEDQYPVIYVTNKKWIDIYREKITLDKIKKINVVSGFSKIGKENWLYLKLNNNYWYYINPDDINYNPWVLAIYRKTDLTKIPLFIIFKDWRINPLNSYYKLDYSNYNNYVVYKLVDKHFNRIIWELLLKINNNFLIK